MVLEHSEDRVIKKKKVLVAYVWTISKLADGVICQLFKGNYLH